MRERERELLGGVGVVVGRLGESLSADCEIYFAVVSRIVVCEAFDRNIEMKFSRRLYVRVYNFELVFTFL